MIDKIVSLETKCKDLKEINGKLEIITGVLEKLQGELSISRNCNELLLDRVESLERRCSANEQYSRKECSEAHGIPLSVKDTDLESKIIQVLSKINVEIETNNIEACHRLGGKGRSIVKFSRRKDVKRVMAAKKT